MNLCINCKHHKTNFLEHPVVLCESPHTISPVDGTRVQESCYSMRARGGICGPEGKLFEPQATIYPDLPKAEIPAK